ncbi:WhiB family transcriptional regulator [Solihabitans fulvus]|uniref:Transcriptional regulator WhiB n=1 Tax=Solihabitans fulvus TaxID=1892852 RepID=A0A5B2XQ34_9PSEU|nr:WhiB family transcriptional regulator [Solihabitans fulvus]
MWQLRGACRGTDSAVFYDPEGERGIARARRAAKAKAICRVCPVLEQCRRHALETQEPYGIWGGLTPVERDSILSVAQRHRPAPAEQPDTASSLRAVPPQQDAEPDRAARRPSGRHLRLC